MKEDDEGEGDMLRKRLILQDLINNGASDEEAVAKYKEIYKQRSRSDEYYRLQEYEAKGVVCSYNNIINIIKAEYSDQKKKNARVQIETLLQDLNETEIDDIEQQIKHRICVSRYYDRDKICNFN